LKLQQQIDELKQQKNDTSEYKVSFPGQYRINFYSVDNDRAGEDRQNAARLRLRQNIDIEFNEQLKSSVRLQLNHTNDNVTNAGDINDNGVQIRHGYIDYAFNPHHNLRTGLVPVLEYHNDLLYSKSWGYNPFALEGFSEVGSWNFHYFAAQLNEDDETSNADDVAHYQFDSIYQINRELDLTFSATMVDIAQTVYNGQHYNAAIKAEYKRDDLKVYVDILSSYSDSALFTSGKNAEGFALLAATELNLDNGKIGLMATYATGDSDGSGFLIPMSFVQTNSYWGGYTGIITVMPQTDTGFASDAVHISNNGYGMSTLQFKADYKLSKQFGLYLGLGWFGNTDAPGRESTVGYDSVLMGKYKLNKFLGLDFGIAHAQLNDSLSGYGNSVLGVASFNQSAGTTRNKTAIFGRLQLEF
jgi:hypothetical protein